MLDVFHAMPFLRDGVDMYSNAGDGAGIVATSPFWEPRIKQLLNTPVL